MEFYLCPIVSSANTKNQASVENIINTELLIVPTTQVKTNHQLESNLSKTSKAIVCIIYNLSPDKYTYIISHLNYIHINIYFTITSFYFIFLNEMASNSVFT